jgi:hypothetical protein
VTLVFTLLWSSPLSRVCVCVCVMVVLNVSV